MKAFYTIGFALSIIAWFYTVYRFLACGDSMANSWIALAFVEICNLGMEIKE